MVSRRGYTLLELVLVLALTVVLGALIYPSYDAIVGDFRQGSAEDQVRAGWAAARAHAMNEGQPYRFCVFPERGNFRIAPDSSDYWSGGDPPAPADPANAPLVIDDALPVGVRFALTQPAPGSAADGDSSVTPGSVDPSSWVPLITFLPDGTARDDAELFLATAGARIIRLQLRGMTGTVRSSKLPENSGQ